MRRLRLSALGFVTLGLLALGCGNKTTEEPIAAPVPVSKPTESLVEIKETPKPLAKVTPKPESPKMAGDTGVTETLKAGADKTKAGAEQVSALAEKAGTAAANLPGGVGEKAKAAAVAAKEGAAKVKASAETVKAGVEKAEGAAKAAGDALKGAGDAAKGLLGGK